jgi:hypothetical protein
MKKSIFSLFILLHIGCNENRVNKEVNVNDSLQINYDSLTNQDVHNDTTLEQNYESDEERSHEEGIEMKLVKWSDGNSYEYYFTEIINITDPKGNVEPVTIYRNNIPSNTNCENKKCRWCNAIIYPVSSSYEEYPDISNVRKYANNGSIASLFWNLGGDISKYIYTDESTNTFAIRTEGILICNYDEVNGYCSNRCYYESKNR